PGDAARGLADALLRDGLVACVNFVGPLVSRYVWQGAIEEAREVLLVMKTSADRVAELRQRIVALHSYQVPEVIELPVEGGYGPYLQWVLDTCAAKR
ncbi:MAG TPA: divalent-cation tolerance protein CutA, partial [Planctomycetota bacterium]|nr:divalent-cation tolerance protein CutA [Planctomycetota bacterium]